MSELDSILEVGQDLDPASDAVLATVVHVSGSAYRRPGARMLMLPDGRRIGTVSGGCLEGDISRKAWWWTEERQAIVRVYDTTSDEEAAWEFGLGCNGVVEVLLERASSRPVNGAMAFIAAQRTAGQPAVVATVIRGATVGDRLLVSPLGVAGGALAGTALEDAVLEQAQAAAREGRSRLLRAQGCEIFVEWIGLPVSLVILGAGHDAIPLAAIARSLGWSVAVADGRPAYARADRFPGAGHVVAMPAGDPLRDVAIDEETAVVMMTHNYPLDLGLLPQVLARRPRYLGILGPRARTARLFSELGLEPRTDVHAPVGLDLGSDAPESVALAIAAEIQAITFGRDGGMLALRDAPIHAPAIEAGAQEPSERTAERPEYCETMACSTWLRQH